MFDTRHHMAAAVCYVYCFALITRAPSPPMSIFKLTVLTDEKGENFLPSFVILQTNALASCENIFHARLSIENTGKCGSNARKFSQKSFSDSLYSYYFLDVIELIGQTGTIFTSKGRMMALDGVPQVIMLPWMLPYTDRHLFTNPHH